MVTLRQGDPLYDAVFGGITLPDFVAKGPTYEQIQSSFYSNPFVREQLTKADTMRADQAHDVRSGMQWAMQTLSVSTQADVAPNFPSVLLPAMRSIITSENIGLALNDAGVARVFDVAENAASGNAVGTAGAVIGLGMAAVGVAVPVVGLAAAAIVGLVTGLVALFEKTATADDVNGAMRAAAGGALKGILQVEDAPLVSIDFRGNPHSSIVDSAYTKVMDGDFVKLLAWYDNEWGYSNRCIDLLKKVAKSL